MSVEITYFVEPYGVDAAGRLFRRPRLAMPSAEAARAMCATLENVGGGAWAFQAERYSGAPDAPPLLRLLAGSGRIDREHIPVLGSVE